MNYNSDYIDEAIHGGDDTEIKGRANLENVQEFSTNIGGNTVEITGGGILFNNAPIQSAYNGTDELIPIEDNAYILGIADKRWANIRALEYYSADGTRGKSDSMMSFNGNNLYFSEGLLVAVNPE